LTAKLYYTIQYGLDKNIKYFWEVHAIDSDGAITKCNNSCCFKPSDVATGIYFNTNNTAPLNFALYQNYPNPFNPTTLINFDLPKASKVSIEIYNLRGQKVRTLVDGLMDAGSHSFQFDATDDMGNKLPTGIYLYMFRTIEFQKIKKLTIMK
jgi:hypothetical protein